MLKDRRAYLSFARLKSIEHEQFNIAGMLGETEKIENKPERDNLAEANQSRPSRISTTFSTRPVVAAKTLFELHQKTSVNC